MAPPSHGAREQKLSDGLRKLQEFQRRKEHSAGGSSSSATDASIRGITPSQLPVAPRQGPHDAGHQHAQHRPTLNTSQSPPQMATVTPAAICTPLTPAAAAVPPMAMATSAHSDLGARLQHLIGQLAAVAASGATRDLRQLEELQRHCVQLARDADQAQRERQAQASQLDSLRASHIQATRTIELLVDEKSRLRATVDSLEEQLRARAHEASERASEVRSLRERAAISDGQMARLLQEKEQWILATKAGLVGATSSSNTATSSEGTSNARLREQITELEEQLRQSAERIAHLQRTEEQSRTAYYAARNELEVAQAYVRQLAGTAGEENADQVKADAANVKQAFESQLEQLREELEAEKHERSAAELIARNLEASNRGLQQRVAELERDASTSANSQQQSSPQTMGQQAGDESSLRQRDVQLQTDIDEEETQQTRADGDVRLADLAKQNDQFQTQLGQLQQQLCSERERWSEQTTALQTRMAATADELQRAKLDASRAVSQNRQLKSQIEELQDVFVKLSNDKLDLTEHLHSERHRAQQLEAQLRNLQTTLELQQAQDSDRDERQSNASAANSAGVDSRVQQYTVQIQRLESQIADWTLRYSTLERQHAQCAMREKVEARLQQQQQQQQAKQINASRVVEDESSRSADTPQTLGDSPGGSLSLSEYEFVDTPQGAHQSSSRQQPPPLTSCPDSVNNNNSSTNVSNTTQYNNSGLANSGCEPIGGEVTESIGDVIDNLSTTSSRSERVATLSDIERTTTKAPMGTPAEASIEAEYERRLTGAALKIARLQDEKCQLEHQVEQLRMETDTISDYIQLYQQQRAALNQRQRERDTHIKQLLEDREALKTKVNQLQSLIAKILPTASNQHQSTVADNSQSLSPSPVLEATTPAGNTSRSPTPNEVIAHKILQTLEDLTEVSTAPPAGLNTYYRCSSCQGCHGRLLSL